MVGSHGSIPNNGLTRRLIAVVALLALLGTACGTKTDSETTTAAAAVGDDADYGSWNDSAEADTTAEADSTTKSSDDDADDTPLEAPALGAPDNDPSAPRDVVAPAAPVQTAQVLAYAIQASEELSYSFEQGMSMRMNMLGMDLDISPDRAFVTGEVSGDDSRVLVDLGAFMTATFDSMDIDLSDPLFAGMLGDLESMSIEVWIVDSTMVIDMSGLAGSIAGLDPTAAGELSVFADGPVSIDLGAIGGTDATALVQQFGQGAQVTDPAALLDALRSVDAVSEAGSSTVDGTAVTVYEASASMTEYYAALGMDITDQLGAMEQFGVPSSSAEAAMIGSMLPAIAGLTVEMKIMIDADGLVRRIESSMDMGAMMSAMFSDVDGADDLGLGEVDIMVDTWQNFGDYGTAITIAPPAAVDKTSDLAGLLDS